MFMKLHFTSDKKLHDVFRIANEVINQSSITDAASLGTYLTTNAEANVKAGFDSTNSTVVKTATLSTAKSHYARGIASSSGTTANYHLWTTEFQSFDSSRKYYVQQVNAGTSGTSSTKIGSTITGGTMASTQLPISSTNLATTDGTALTVGGTTQTGGAVTATETNGYTTVRTFWLQINDKGMIWSTTNGVSYNVGFGNGYNDPSKYSGPWIFSQYARNDYHNTDANSIVPLMFTNLGRGAGVGFGGNVSDWRESRNSMATNPDYTANHPFRVFNLINAHPQAGTSWPAVNFPVVNWGLGSRFDEIWALNGTALGAGTNVNGSSYGAAIFETVNTRYPSADLKSQGFAMLPISWRHSYYGCTGGNMSDKSGYYLFNGDYYPGDQFTYGNKTYVIIPTYVGYSHRVGIAVPME